MGQLSSSRMPIAAAGAGRLGALVAGDAVAFMIFAAIGRASHAEAAGLSALLQVAETAAPFMVAWFAAAPFLGAFRPDVAAAPRRMLARTALAWLVAWPIGLGLRALIRQSGIPLTFALITLVTVLCILGLWRALFALVASRRV
jgi:hypothetical protein